MSNIIDVIEKEGMRTDLPEMKIGDTVKVLVKIKEGSTKLKLVNYLNKYISKDNCKVEYNSKAYYHTYNLNSKNKIVALLTNEEINSLINKDVFTNIDKVKDNEKFVVYRVYPSEGKNK